MSDEHPETTKAPQGAGPTAAELDTARAAAYAWLAQDPDEITRAELTGLIAAAAGGTDVDAASALHARFASRLEFGTAGIRGEIGAGPTRMNRVLVSQAAAGFAAWLLGRGGDQSIVIGFDGRTNSREFALDTAEIMAGAGVRALLLPRRLPTPVLAFAVRHLAVSAGVMVTASHNPAADNGYKVYLGGSDAGSQIVAPVDTEIAAHITRIASQSTLAELPRSRSFDLAPEEVIDAYVSESAAMSGGGVRRDQISFVYTAMHGVGFETAARVFEAAGFQTPVSVVEQQEPDAAFPTVAFPNPEEPGALDLAITTATEAGVDLIIANDPDADRLAIGVPDPVTHGWRRLAGNEVGYLLGWRAAERLVAEGRTGTLAASLVSSPALRAVADQYGFEFTETLTGFKWISRVPDLAYGFEEALGYLVDPAKVRDKDGISAAVDFLALAGELRASGRTVDDHLDEFAVRFGAFASAQISIRVTDLGQIHHMMTALRLSPPSHIGSSAVARIDDFEGGVDSFTPTDILRIHTTDGCRVIVRPSGTEPKLKAYIDASSTNGSGPERRMAAQRLVNALESGMRELLSPGISPVSR